MITETTISAWLISKIAPTVAALFAGLTLVMFWTPQKLLEKGRIASVFIACAISATFGFAFTGLFLHYLGLPTDSLDYVIGAGWLLGFFSVAIMNWMANWFANRSTKDMQEIITEVKGK
jgi:hypothetical protein